MYSIGETAKKVGLSAHTLRYYEKEGLMLNIRRDDKGIRVFADEDIHWIGLLQCFKKTGMTMKEMKQIVGLIMEGRETIPQRLKILKEHRVVVLDKIQELKENLYKIDEKIEMYENELA